MSATGWKNLPQSVLDPAGVSRDSRGRVVVPYFRASGALHNRKLFAPDGRSWWEDKDRPLLPFGLEALTDPPHDRALLIAEGESDTLALRATFRIEGCDVLGLPGASTWRCEWLLWLQPYGIVYLIPDGDDAGDALAAAIRSDRPDVRVVETPRGEDARSLLQRDGWYAVHELLERADAKAAERDWLLRVHDAIQRSSSLEECQRVLRGEMELPDAA